MTTVAAILAAGRGARFGGGAGKLRASFRGRPLVSWAVEAAVAAGFDQVLVVVGADELRDLVPAPVRVVANPRWEEGIATSLATAVAEAREASCAAVVVGLGDQPLVTAGAWRTIRDAASPIAVATYDGRRGHPVRLAREVWPWLPATGDEGARTLMAERPELVAELPCPGNPVDVDTQEDLARWS